MPVTRPESPRSLSNLLRYIPLAMVFSVAACSDPSQDLMAPVAVKPAFDVVQQTFMSGPNVMTWDPIIESNQPSDFGAAYCTATPKVGLDANWQNPHNAYVLGGHPWAFDKFYAPWINALPTLASDAANPVYPNYNWTKYTTQVEGNGTFVIRLLADNCSWIYLDGTLVGVQADNHDNISYGLTLNGSHTLTFIIFDGGGAAGGKFILETTTNPPPALNPDLDDDGHVNESDAFPLDKNEWQDSDQDGVGDNGDAFPNDPAETVDTDHDGHGDNSDAYPNDPARYLPDYDNDGINDAIDNCSTTPNADQADLDHDGLGDACDSDIDGDGVANGSDAFPTNPAESADTDHDGIGNNADAFDMSNTGPTVYVGTCNSGAPNLNVGGGTWFNDLVAAAYASAGNHGAFVRAVSDLADSWKKAGQITGREQGAIVSCAARTK